MLLCVCMCICTLVCMCVWHTHIHTHTYIHTRAFAHRVRVCVCVCILLSISFRYSFALEETGRYDEAEAAAQQNLSINTQSPWVTHALSHVIEEDREVKEGVQFLASTHDSWKYLALVIILPGTFASIILVSVHLIHYNRETSVWTKLQSCRVRGGSHLSPILLTRICGYQNISDRIMLYSAVLVTVVVHQIE